MTIRNAKPDDATPLAELARALGESTEAVRFSQDIAQHAQGFYVAEVNGIVAGYLVMRIEQHPGCVQGRSPIQLWRLFVAPEHQGKGVAASLVSQAFNHARAGKHDVVWLGTSEDNARAIAFYRKHGFQSAGVAQLHPGHNPHQDLIMSSTVQ